MDALIALTICCKLRTFEVAPSRKNGAKNFYICSVFDDFET